MKALDVCERVRDIVFDRRDGGLQHATAMLQFSSGRFRTDEVKVSTTNSGDLHVYLEGRYLGAIRARAVTEVY